MYEKSRDSCGHVANSWKTEGSHPAIGFEGDLLPVLDQVIRRGDAESVIRRIRVETDDCDWIPLSR